MNKISHESGHAASIQCLGVTVEFEPRSIAVDRVDLTVQSGEIVALIGPSGCGKTTLLRAMAGLQTLTAGGVALSPPALASRGQIGFVFQQPALLPWATTLQNVVLPLKLIGRGSHQDQVDSAMESLEAVKLADAWDKRPHQLSGGMQMRASIARALVTDPNVLLLDEPFAALDEMLRTDLGRLLLQLREERHFTAVMVTHNISESIFLSRRIAVMRAGLLECVIDNPLPWPRSPDIMRTAAFADFFGTVSDRLRGRTAKSNAEASGGAAMNNPVDRSASATVAAVALRWLPAIGVALAALVIWQLVVWAFQLPAALLPKPRQVWDAATDNRMALTKAFGSTGLAAASGLIAAIASGSLISVAFSQSRPIRLAFFPYVIFLQTVPIVAIAPLLIIWSGYQFRTVVIVTVIVCLFPIINSVTAGLMAVDRQWSDLFTLYGAGRTKKLLRLQVPAAVPYLVLGAKTSSGLAVIGAIVAEFFVGSGTDYDGLGTLMTKWQGFVKTDALIAAVFTSTLLGLILFGLVHLTSRTLLRRWSNENR